MAKTKQKNSGFTLLELLVVVGIFTFMAAATYGTLTAGRRAWRISRASINLQQETRLGLERMVREIQLAGSATVAADNTWVQFGIPFDADGNGFLDLIPQTSIIVTGADDPQDFNNNGLFWEQNWSIRYVIANDQIVRQVLDGAGNQVSQRIIIRNRTGTAYTSRVNTDPALTNFTTAPDGGTGFTKQAVEIDLTTEITTIEGWAIAPIQTILTTRVDLRN